MTTAGTRNGMGWGARILIGLTLILAGGAAATWGLARSDEAARLLGVADKPTVAATVQPRPGQRLIASPSAPVTAAEQQRLDQLEQRLARVENQTQRAAGSAGRADSLLIAIAARRAIDRGVALGYLERLLVDRFGAGHERAVATIVTGARDPVLLNQLIVDFEALGPELRRGAPGEDWWSGLKRELGSIVSVRRAKEPAPTPSARFERALQRLQAGDVDRALAETMRMPGAANAQAWTADARRYIAIHRALDEVESAALMPAPAA